MSVNTALKYGKFYHNIQLSFIKWKAIFVAEKVCSISCKGAP